MSTTDDRRLAAWQADARQVPPRLMAALPPRELAPAPHDERLALAGMGLPPLADDDDLPLTDDELDAVSAPGAWHLTATGGAALAELLTILGRLR